MSAAQEDLPAADRPPHVEASEHPMVLAAMGRLASQGGWARLLAGKPLEDRDDILDAALLVAAGVLRETATGLEPAQPHPWHFDPASLAGGTIAVLRRALRHAEGGSSGWSCEDLDIVRAQGRGSVAAAGAVADGLLPLMPGTQEAFVAGGAELLDVGVGVAGFTRELCRRFPTTRAVGIDVLAPVLEVAQSQLADAGLLGQVELRLQSITDLHDRDRFDLAWLPQPFIPRADLVAGLSTVRRALRPDRWLVAPITAPPTCASAVHSAIREHSAHLTGGGPISVAEMRSLLTAAGFAEVRTIDQTSQVTMLARRP